MENSITRNIRLALPATVYCLPGARVSNIEANLWVLASRRENQGTQAHTTVSFSDIVIQVVTNHYNKDEAVRHHKKTPNQDVWVSQKDDRHLLIVSGPLPVRIAGWLIIVVSSSAL